MAKKWDIKRKDGGDYEASEQGSPDNTLAAGLLMVTVFVIAMYGEKIAHTYRTAKYCIEYLLGL